MTKEEYKYQKLILEKELDKNISELAKECAFSNNPYNVGDTIKDHSGCIKIQVIQYTRGEGFLSNGPECIYTGIELNKNMSENKRGNRRKISMSSIIKD